jgi:gluconolactonase
MRHMNQALFLAIPFLFAVTVCKGQGQEKSIRGVLPPEYHVELIQSGFQRLEGPVPASDGGPYFSDVGKNRMYKLSANGTISVWRENTNAANGLLQLRDGRLLAAECGCYSPPAHTGRIVAVMPDGEVKVISAAFNGQPLKGPNDLIADKKGGIYFTDPGPFYPSNVAPTERRNTYYIRPGGEVVLLDHAMVYPNGITLSLDEKTLFVDDTFDLYVYAFDIQQDDQVKNKQRFAKLHDPEQWPSWGLRSRADGMATDSKGRLYVATASGVQVIDPHGQYLGTIRTPAIIRNLAFGGPQRNTLYMTALVALYKLQMSS